MKPHFKRITPIKRVRDWQRQSDSEADDIRITNETVAARREEVLGSARKYIYPLRASKHRVVKVSTAIFITAVVSFFVFCLVDLYKLQSTSTFIYGVTQVVPFPVAVIGTKRVVSYNDYLFELRHYMHYYQTQQHVDFNSAAGKQQLVKFKEQSLNQAIQNAYVQQLASENGISVSSRDVDAAVALVRTQNRLGASDQVFRSVLNEFWGWSVADFRRELRQELLAQKVVDKLDSKTHDRATQALGQLNQGTDFATLAKQVSDDASTRDNGGDYGVLIDTSSTTVPPQVIEELYKLKPGEHSDIINTGYSLEIVKVLDVQGNQIHAAHMSFNLQPITAYTTPLQFSEKPFKLIHV